MLTLFYKPTCPFSQRVLGEAEDLGVKLNLRDIASDGVAYEALIAHGGKQQVPYLVDEERGEAMYESGDIIEYLREHYYNEADGNFNGVKLHQTNQEPCDSCQ